VAAMPLPGGVAGNLLHFAHPRAVHRMWWTDDPYYLYQLRLETPKGKSFTFTLRPISKQSEGAPPPKSLTPVPSPTPSHRPGEGNPTGAVLLFSLFSRSGGGRWEKRVGVMRGRRAVAQRRAY
jgi:hypothetical protein